MFKLGGPPKQKVLIFSNTHAVEEEKQTIDRLTLRNEQHMEAWAIDGDGQIENENGEYEQWVQLGDCSPLIINDDENKSRIDRSNIDAIESQAVDDEIAWQDLRKRKNRKMVFVGIIACMMFLTLSIIALVQVIRSDAGLQLPGM